jgi:hypothetical protein
VKGLLPAPDFPAASGDGPTATPRHRFRTFLSDHVTTAHALEFYVEQALPRFAHDGQVRLAVEELVDHAGRLLGFTVARDDDWEWSVWRSPGLARFVVNVETPAGAAAGLGQFARQRDIVTLSDGESAAEPTTGVTVVCGEGHQRLIEDAVVVRRAADHVRLITTGALIRLVTRARSGRASHADALTIFRPAGAFADALVSLFD